MLPVPLPSRGNLLFPGVQGLLGYKETQAACSRAAASSPVPQTSAAPRTLSHTYQASSKPRSYFSLSLSLKGDRDTSSCRDGAGLSSPVARHPPVAAHGRGCTLPSGEVQAPHQAGRNPPGTMPQTLGKHKEWRFHANLAPSLAGGAGQCAAAPSVHDTEGSARF